MLGGTYSSGTITVDNGSTTVNGLDTMWNDVLEGDELWPSNQGPMIIGADVVHPFDTIELLTPWPGPDLFGSTYVIVKTSWKRHDVTELQKLWRTLAAELEATGNFIFVEGDEPDPEMGENGQFALKVNVAPWQLWYKEVNVWNLQGVPVGSRWAGPWNSGDTYQVNDVVSRNGNSYIAKTVNTNQPPESNPDDWDLTATGGAPGMDGGVITIPYYFSNVITIVDPGNGHLRLNNATQNAANTLALDLVDNRGIDFSLVLDAALGTSNPVRGHIRLHKATDTTKFLIFAVTAMLSPAGFRQYSVSCIGSSGATPFADLDPIVVNITRAGDQGIQGVQGIQGIVGPLGGAGGMAALPYVVDGLTTMDSDPGIGKMRFGSVPQANSTVIRLSTTTALGSPVTALLASIGAASTSTVKVGGRIFINAGQQTMTFYVTAVQMMTNYANLTVQMIGASVPDPFANGSSIVFDWSPKGDKGDAATIAVGSTITGEPGTDASVVNAGTSSAAVFNFTIPRGDTGDSFTPVEVVATLPGRAAFDAAPEFTASGERFSVLVESDSSNGDLPTLYFKMSNASGDWSGGITWQPAGAADAIAFDGTASGLEATNVQAAVDETVVMVRAIPDPVAMAMIFGGA